MCIVVLVCVAYCMPGCCGVRVKQSKCLALRSYIPKKRISFGIDTGGASYDFVFINSNEYFPVVAFRYISYLLFGWKESVYLSSVLVSEYGIKSIQLGVVFYFSGLYSVIVSSADIFVPEHFFVYVADFYVQA